MTPRARNALAQSGGVPMAISLTGATQGVDSRLLQMTQDAWSQILPGATVNVTTGVSDHSPTNHAPGHAVDYQVIRPDGSVVQWNDPEARAASQLFWEMGGHGVGAGPTYMGGTHMHWDISANGVRAWSDDDGGASDRGEGAAQWMGGVSAPGLRDMASGAPSGAPSARVPSGVPSGGPPRVPSSAPSAQPGTPQNALAQFRRDEEEEERRNALLDPRAFMSRREFRVVPYGMLG